MLAIVLPERRRALVHKHPIRAFDELEQPLCIDNG